MYDEVQTDEDEDRAFWLAASESAMKKIWDNPEDDVYAQLLEDDER